MTTQGPTEEAVTLQLEHIGNPPAGFTIPRARQARRGVAYSLDGAGPKSARKYDSIVLCDDTLKLYRLDVHYFGPDLFRLEAMVRLDAVDDPERERTPDTAPPTQLRRETDARQLICSSRGWEALAMALNERAVITKRKDWAERVGLSTKQVTNVLRTLAEHAPEHFQRPGAPVFKVAAKSDSKQLKLAEYCCGVEAQAWMQDAIALCTPHWIRETAQPGLS